ncbi:MAG: hypothetical protein CL505_05850 [Actinobacteria bacterium]|nr:hypothetical protein [Actinomycetota bacterium]
MGGGEGVVRVGALCAGYGGLELGLQLAGIDTDLVWVAETDKHASAVLDARFGVPNLGDLTEIADPPQVDAITAGFPCQPVSHAGRRAGIDDERWLIRDVVSVARRAGAQWLFLENVRGLLTANQGDAFGQVLDALAEGGFDAEWACIRADQSVGACHRRDRWFAVAHADGAGSEAWGDARRASQLEDGGEPVGHTPSVAYACGERHGGGQDGGEVGCVDGGAEGEASQRQRARQVPVDRGAASVADADSPGRGEQCGSVPVEQKLRSPERGGSQVGWGDYADAIARWEWASGRCAPAPVTDSKLSSRFVEWMMGLPDGWVTGAGLSRSQELKMLGNGVVPQQAAAAYGWLLEQIGEMDEG